MKIWLIKEGETIPQDTSDRLARMGMLARDLAKNGHTITWWSSTFLHGKKKYFCNEYRECTVLPNETLLLLHSKHGYQKNMSLERIRYLYLLGREFRKRSEEKEKSDIILCSWPSMSFAHEAVRYGKRHNIPVIIDVRDMWPDIFVQAFPKVLQGIAPLLLLPMKRWAAGILKKATHIVSMSPSALEWACSYAGRKPGPMDRYISICNDAIALTEEEKEKNLCWWGSLGATEKTWNICFFSSLSNTGIDLDTVICAVKLLAERYPNIRLLIGGKGDAEEYLRSVAGESHNIIFGGWLDQGQMNSAMGISKCGMYCLRNRSDLTNTFSNKAIQYLSAGLPIITSLSGYARTYLQDAEMGLAYEEGSVQSCANVIETLYLNEDLRCQMGKRALAQFEKRYDSKIVNKQFEEYFFEVLQHWRDIGVVSDRVPYIES